MNQNLRIMICCITCDQPKSLNQSLAQVKFNFNNMVNHSISRSLLSIVYAKLSNVVVDLMKLALNKTYHGVEKLSRNIAQLYEDKKK